MGLVLERGETIPHLLPSREGMVISKHAGGVEATMRESFVALEVLSLVELIRVLAAGPAIGLTFRHCRRCCRSLGQGSIR